MIRRLVFSMVAILVGTAVPAAGSDQTLRVGTAEWRPWQIVENGHLTGITPDLLEELGRRTGCRMTIRPLPHKRMMAEFEAGRIDMEPAVNPAWRDGQRDISVYTIPFYATGDVILVSKDSHITGGSVRSFFGMTLGCGLGYYYPEGFQEAFNDGLIQREDNPVAEMNLVKLALKRIDGIIVDKTQALYLWKTTRFSPADFVTAYEFKPSELSLRLHRQRQDLVPVLNAALAQMLADGTIARIMADHLR